jgi:molecular chaperone GrpE
MPSSPESETTTPADQQNQHEPHDGGQALQDELESLRDRNAQLEDRYKRALADLDNYRKRSVREVDRRVADSREALVRDWLEAVDAVDRALVMEPENPLAEGLRMVLEQMEAILSRQGVQRVGRPGEQFDPERHEAVGIRETDEVPDRTVLDVARSGYAIGDRVVRPAEVIVSRSSSNGREA